MDIVRALDNQYCLLRDMQYAAYTKYAKHHNLTTNELFVLDIVWFDEGCLQSYICDRLSANKQTVNEIVKKFLRLGYFELRQSVKDKRSKGIFMTESGHEYVGAIIPQAAKAEVDSMREMKQEDAEILVRLTKEFSENMKKNFESLIK